MTNEEQYLYEKWGRVNMCPHCLETIRETEGIYAEEDMCEYHIWCYEDYGPLED